MSLKSLSITFSVLLSLNLWSQTLDQTIVSQIEEAQQITKNWMDKKTRGLTKKDLYEGQAERADFIITGIPKYVKEVDPSDIVYRHYTGTHTKVIVESGQLKTGITPYVVISPGYSREVYEDLVGIFLTTPLTPPERVGLPRNSNADYIDFKVYEGTPVVEIEKEILLIPGRPDLPEWLKALYLDYKSTGRFDSHYFDLFQKVDARGGANPTYMKINILTYRMGGKIYNK